MVTMTYAEISNFQFAQALQKINSTPTHGTVASQIHRVVKLITWARDRITKEYQDTIVNTYGKRQEDGAIFRPIGEPMGFEPMEEKQAEFLKAQEDFGKHTIDLNVDPFTVQLLGDIKVSAQDLEALKGLYVGNYDAESAVNKGAVSKVSSLR